jgi:hypothetical protein
MFLGLPDPHPDPDPLVRGMDPRILIHTKISWICNTGCNKMLHDVAVWLSMLQPDILHPIRACCSLI